MRSLKVAAAGLFASLLGMQAAQAAPISYQGDLTGGGTVEWQTDLEEPDYWSFFAKAGTQISITVYRLEAAFDPAFDLFRGVSDDDWDLELLYSADDEIATLPGYEGMGSDAQYSFVVDQTGNYSISVRSWMSWDPGPDGVYSYRIILAQVPEPAAIGLLGAGLLGLAAVRRRKAK